MILKLCHRVLSGAATVVGCSSVPTVQSRDEIHYEYEKSILIIRRRAYCGHSPQMVALRRQMEFL